jgi:hypothetical protein
VQQLAWLYFGMCDPVKISSPILSAAMSGYCPPDVVADLAIDRVGRGVYEIRQRPLGLVQTGYYKPPDYRMKTEEGGIVRYSYCTPEFIIGTAMLEARPFVDWAMISSQNRWHGAIFLGHKNARIVPQCEAEDDRVTFNQQWSVQHKGTLICQKLKTSTKCKTMRVWIAQAGLGAPVETDGWVFVEAKGAYAAVRPVLGGFVWQKQDKPEGSWMVLNAEWSPVILEVARKVDYKNLEAFQKTITSQPMIFQDDLLHYEGIYGDTFTLDATQQRVPEINGVAVDFVSGKALDSPFLQADWNGNVVTIQKCAQKKVLVFDEK